MSDYKSQAKEKLFGPSLKPVKYSSVDTRYSSLHGFMCGAEINEVNVAPQMEPGVLPNDWTAMNIKSGVNQADCPSAYGISSNRGNDKIASQVFTAGWIRDAWRRINGNPVE